MIDRKAWLKKLKDVRRDMIRQFIRDSIIAALPALLMISAILGAGYYFIDPAPPRKFVISTGDQHSNYFEYAKKYSELIAKEGIILEVKQSKGNWDNLKRIEANEADAGFVQDGLGDREKMPHVETLGSLYYEPIWVFYRKTPKREFRRFSEFKGMKLAVGEMGGETHSMAKRMLTESGVTKENSVWLEIGTDDALEALKTAKVDVAFFIASANNDLIKALMNDKSLSLFNTDQAEAISRKFPYLHHVVLPHGTFDLGNNIPDRDVDLLAPTATLAVHKNLHPALAYLLLNAAAKVHHVPGVFERKGEFPSDKDYIFPVHSVAKEYFKSGAPFWLKHLPFWLATLVQRFIFVVIPLAALIVPILRSIPKFFQWRARNRIYQRYGELKFLESQIFADESAERRDEFLSELDNFEERVNRMRVPLDLTDFVYSLRGHIHYVRERLVNRMTLAKKSAAQRS